MKSSSSFTLFFVVTIAAALVGCGSSDDPPSNSNGSSSGPLAYCTELTVKVDGAPIVFGDSTVDRLSQGDLVIRNFSKDPLFGKYLVDYLNAKGTIVRGEISQNDVTDNCPSNAAGAYYIDAPLNYVSDLEATPASTCALTTPRIMHTTVYSYDDRVSKTQAKVVLTDPLPNCALTSGFMPYDQTPFVVYYPSDHASEPMLLPTRRAR